MSRASSSWRWWLSALYATGILVLALVPAELCAAPPSWLPQPDKLGHILLYGGWALILHWAWPAWPARMGARILIVVALASAYGALLEGLQALLLHMGRSASWGDALANLLGAAAGSAGWWALDRRAGFGRVFGG